MAFACLLLALAFPIYAGEVRELRPVTQSERAAAEAAEAAAIAERSAQATTPIKFTQPLQGVFEISTSNHAYRIVVDPSDGGLIAVEVESTRKTESEIYVACSNALESRVSARVAYSNSQAKTKATISGLNNNGVAGIRQALIDLQAQVDALQERLR